MSRKLIRTLGFGLSFLIVSCQHTELKDLEPYKVIYSLTSEGMFCTPKSPIKKELVCVKPKELANDPVWKDQAFIIHERNLKEKFAKLLNALKQAALESLK